MIVAYPTIAVGVKPLDWLQLGVAFASGFAHIEVTNYTRALSGGEDRTGDTPTTFTVKDRFVPRLVGSIHLIPHDRLDIVGAFRVEDTIRASGSVKAKTELLGDGGGKATYSAPRPTWISGGIRYAHRKTKRPSDPQAVSELSGRVEDPMSNETFDVEVNVVYERNKAIKNHKFAVENLVIGDLVTLPDFSVDIPHRWKDQLSIRAGGDWNAIPGVLALRTGVSYETEGFRKGYAYADYFPFERVGVHGGLTVRMNRFELSASFAHFFQKTFDNGDGLGDDGEVLSPQIITTLDPNEPTLKGDAINGGKYSGRINVASFALRYFFR